MKRKNREALRKALLDLRNERGLFLEQVRILMDMEKCGIAYDTGGYPKKYDHSAGQDWEIKLDILEEIIEEILEDER